MKSLIWLTRDLRTRDNQLLRWLEDHPSEVMAVVFEPTSASAYQLRFFHETVADLRARFQARAIAVLIVRGTPESEIPKLVESNGIDEILVTKAFNSRDQGVLERVERELPRTNVRVFDQRTLLCAEDLPFPLPAMPLVFTSFRKKVEASLEVRPPIDSGVERLVGFRPVIPSSTVVVDHEAVQGDWPALPFSFVGGESAGWARVTEYFWSTRSVSHYKETRNGMLERDDSSKLSPWLANGSISARSVYHELKEYEREYGGNESTYWLFFELLWRDYFKFLSLTGGERVFSVDGLSDRPRSWKQDHALFQSWCAGDTGLDFVDANMKELALTGWMSNRGRQNVASHLAKGLGVDWTWGARYFESQLIDADPESNWGNWMYVAGVGTDPRDRKFDVERQAEMYDPEGAYRKKWLGRAEGEDER